MPNRRQRRAQAAAARKLRKIEAKAARPAAQRDTPKQFALAGAVTITAADGEKRKLPTFEGVAYTGAPMTPMGWWNPVIIDLAGIEIPSQHRPVLRQHDHEQVVGHTTAVAVDGGQLTCAGVCSGQKKHVDKVAVPAANGFQWQMSIGADPLETSFLEAGETTTVNGREVTGPCTISRRTRLGEISFVPLGADGDTSATVNAAKGKTMHWQLALKELMAKFRAAKKVELAKYSDADVDKMSADEARAALKECMDAEASDDDEDDDDEDDGKKSKSAKGKGLTAAQIKAQADSALADLRRSGAAELQRHSDIKAAVAKHGVTDVEIEENGQKKKVNLAAHAIGQNWSAERAELEALRCARPAAGVPGGLVYSTSTAEASEAVIEAAVFHAARHQFQLEHDDFYFEPTPDGKGQARRMPAHVQADAQRDFKPGGRYTDQVRQAAHNLFANPRAPGYIGQISPKVMFTTALRAMGYGGRLDLTGEHGVTHMLRLWDHYERQQVIQGEGTSNLSISNMLANVQNKFALQGYLFTEQAWREVFAIRPVNDFKPAKSINLLGDVIYKVLGPSGELENASISDQAFANQAQPYGRIITIPWTHIVNDDLGMLTQVPLKIGQGAGLALNDNVWTLWKNMTATVNGDDGVAFFRTTSLTTAAAMKAGNAYKPNKATGAGSAFGDTALTTAKALFDNQIDPNGNPLGFDGMVPVLLHGPTNWRAVTAQMQSVAIVYGGASAALQPNGNPWQGMLKPVMSRYLENANYLNSTTAWFLLFNPVALAVAEVCFLNGVDTPAVLQAGPDFQFDRPGISIRGTMPFGSNQQNFRGGVYNVGA